MYTHRERLHFAATMVTFDEYLRVTLLNMLVKLFESLIALALGLALGISARVLLLIPGAMLDHLVAW